MTLVDRLQAYLKRLRDRPGSFVPPSSEELAQLRRHLRSRFEQAQQNAAPAQQEQLRESYGKWTDTLEDFVWEVCWSLDELALDQSEKSDALRVAVDLVAPEFSDPDELTVPIWRDALRGLVHNACLSRSYWHRIRTLNSYASQLRLTERRENTLQVSAMGEILLQLVGQDAVRWVLAVEVVQSFGPDDPWRMSRTNASALSKVSSIPTLTPDGPPPWSEQMLERCASLLLLSFEWEYSPAVVFPTDTGRRLLAEAGSQETPFTLLAQALAADQSAAALTPIIKSSPDTAAEATVRHARMVAHEIRNALVPVRVALKQLWRDLSQDDQDGLTAELRNIIDNNVERIFRFVDESVRLTRLASEPPEIFDVLPAIRDAISTLDRPPRRPIESTFGPGADALRVRGHRQRLVLALMNLLRNAVQAKDPDVLIEVQVSALTEQKRFRIVIDDDGPGVSAEQRTSIFQNGVSHRTDGTGHGLTLVREVIEREMSGKITCEESQRGGARFIIDLPWA